MSPVRSLCVPGRTRSLSLEELLMKQANATSSCWCQVSNYIISKTRASKASARDKSLNALQHWLE